MSHGLLPASPGVVEQPSVLGLTTLITAWSKSDDPTAAERADLLLQSMNRLYEEGVIDSPPNKVTYSAVLGSYAKSSLPRANDRAVALLGEMERKAREGQMQVRPNVVAYRHVIATYAKLGMVEEAEAVLERMIAEYHRGNEVRVMQW